METSGQLMGQGATQAPPEDCEEPRGPRHTHSHRGSPIPSGHVSLAAGHRGLPRPVPSAAPSLMGPGCTLRPRAARAPGVTPARPRSLGTDTHLTAWMEKASFRAWGCAGRKRPLLAGRHHNLPPRKPQLFKAELKETRKIPTKVAKNNAAFGGDGYGRRWTIRAKRHRVLPGFRCREAVTG